MTRRKPAGRRENFAFNFEHEGHAYCATASRYEDGSLGEPFLDKGKINTPLQEHAETSATLVSLLLQHGLDIATIRHSISGPIATALALEAPS